MVKFISVVISLYLITAPYAFSLEQPPTPPAEPKSLVPSTRASANQGDTYRDNKAGSEDHKFDPAKLLDPHYMFENLLDRHNLVIALSTTGVTIDVECPYAYKFPSAWVYKLASLVHYGYEIYAANALSQNHIRKASELKLSEEKLKEAKKAGEIQRQSLEMALDEEQETLRYIQEKKKWLSGIRVAQMVATGLALMETVNDLITMGYGAVVGGAIGAYTGAGGTGFAAMPFFILGGMSYGARYGGMMCQGVPDPAALTLAGALVASYTFIKKDPRYQKFGVFLGTNVAVISTASVLLYDLALMRALSFGAHVFLVTKVLEDLSAQEKVTQQNIDDLRRVLAELGKGQENGGVADTGGGGPNMPSTNYGDEGKRWYGTHGGRHCWSGGQGNSSFSTDCKSPMNVGEVKLGPDMDLPYLSDMSGKVANAAQDMAKGDADKARAAMGELASQAARVKAVNDELKAKIKELLKNKGKDIDFAKEEQRVLAEIRKQAAAKGATGTLAAAPAGTSYRATIDPAAPKGATGPTGSQEKSAPAPVVNQNTNNFKGIGANVSTDKDIISANAKDSDYTEAGAGIGDFETSESDIINDKSVSIFKVITHRYALSYERLMDRKRKD